MIAFKLQKAYHVSPDTWYSIPLDVSTYEFVKEMFDRFTYMYSADRSYRIIKVTEYFEVVDSPEVSVAKIKEERIITI